MPVIKSAHEINIYAHVVCLRRNKRIGTNFEKESESGRRFKK